MGEAASGIAVGTASIAAQTEASQAALTGPAVDSQAGNVGTGDGFNAAELAAVLTNKITAGPEDQENVLGLDIQSNDVGKNVFVRCEGSF